jgi:hypothetical protein
MYFRTYQASCLLCSEYSREVTVSVTTACSYSEFSCSYSFQLPRASVPPPHGRGGGCGAPVWSPGHIVPQGGRQPRAPWAEDMPVKPQNLTEDHPASAVGPLPSFWWDARCTGCRRTSCNRFWCPTTAMPRKHDITTAGVTSSSESPWLHVGFSASEVSWLRHPVSTARCP